MVKVIVVYAATLIAFCACDFLWLGWIAKDLYAKEIGALLLSSFKVGVGALFYAIYAGGVVVFCVYPALSERFVDEGASNGCVVRIHRLRNLRPDQPRDTEGLVDQPFDH